MKGKVVTDETYASNEVDPEKLEEALNKLQEVFCFLPRLLIRQILSRDDIKGDLKKASQKLQEFQGVGNRKELSKKTQHYKSEQLRQHHNDQSAGRGRRGYRGARPPKSMSSVQTNQGDEEPFEHNKLAVSGLNASTTDEGVLNFIEAMSGEEVEEVSMLGNGKALITMAQPITGKDFTRINHIFLPC